MFETFRHRTTLAAAFQLDKIGPLRQTISCTAGRNWIISQHNTNEDTFTSLFFLLYFIYCCRVHRSTSHDALPHFIHADPPLVKDFFHRSNSITSNCCNRPQQHTRINKVLRRAKGSIIHREGFRLLLIIDWLRRKNTCALARPHSFALIPSTTLGSVSLLPCAHKQDHHHQHRRHLTDTLT